jgi:protein-disulfide isomerase
MSNGKKNNANSSLPLIIIGLVLIAALAGAWWLFNRNTNPTRTATNTATNSSANRTPNAANNPLGAQPPNLLGSPNATVTVEEFADFQCGACASVHPRMKELTSIYGSRIRFVFRHYPLAIPAHDKAYNAAVATEAAGMQGSNKFWEMQNLLFTNQQVWTANPNYRQLWEGYASQIGLDVERFKSDMAGLNAKARVDADMQRGRSLNISSTPTIFVNGQSVPFEQMTVETLRQIIDAELLKAPASQQQAPASGGASSSSQSNTATTTNTAANTQKK